MNHQQELYGGSTATTGLILPDSSSSFFPWPLPPVHHHSFNNNQNHFNSTTLNPVHEHMENQFLCIPPSVPYGSFFNRRPNNNPNFQFAYDHSGPSSNTSSDHLRMLSVAVQPAAAAGFGLHGEIMGKMTAQEIMDAKALAASKSHSEAERRRRERINNHLARLRSLLPSTTKTDKASLLAEVIQHVKELKRQTSLIAETSPIPTEIDELTVDTSDDIVEDGKLVIKASLCCEDRSDLLPDLIKTLKSLRLRTLKAEITTLGGRVKNVLFITGENEDDEEEQQRQYCISSIQEALKGVMEKTTFDQNNHDHHQSSSGNAKRQRTHHVNML